MAHTPDLALKVLNHPTGQPKLTVGETAQLDVTLDDSARMSIANAGSD